MLIQQRACNDDRVGRELEKMWRSQFFYHDLRIFIGSIYYDIITSFPSTPLRLHYLLTVLHGAIRP